MKKLMAAVGVLFLAMAAFAAETNLPALIPLPQAMVVQPGVFRIDPATRVFIDSGSRAPAEFLLEPIRRATGYPLRPSTKWFPGSPGANTIWLTTKNADTNLGPEGYELLVATNSVTVRAFTPTGIFYGIQTLLQLLPPAIFSSNVTGNVSWQIPAVQIKDWPRFPWRGLMLDVSRHFYNKAQVEKIIDAMARYKLNTFHWHLTDDQGWRIEIKKYPKLTTIGAWRDSVGFGLASNSTTAYDAQGRYGGFYTQADIREVVKYAAVRQITIVPEIEMPGHSMAALAAYSQFSCTGKPFTIPAKGGVMNGIYNPANEATFEFLDDVLTEVFQLFPGKYIHIGGDEVPMATWNYSPECQALMQREGLKNGDELEGWFIRRIEKFVNTHGKTLIGWSEIARGGLAQNAVVMDWIGGGLEAAGAGHDVVMTPTDFCYFDFYQSQAPGEPRAIGGYLPLAKVYAFEPVPAQLPAALAGHVLGPQANLWTEYIASFSHVEYMLFPRLCALAEVGWSAKSARDLDSFQNRLKVDEQRLAALGVNYREETSVKIGGWTPSQITTNGASLEWDVTGNMTAPGKYNVSFNYLEGACGIDIAWASLWEDGREISHDAHAGFTGANPRKPVYTLDVPMPRPGAHYTLRARIAGSGGTDSSGDVFLDLKPD